MIQLVEANWMAVALAIVVGLLVAYWVFARATKPAARSHRPDVLDEGAAPAQRNQALIDAPSATASVTPVVTPPAAGIMGGVAEIIAAAVQEEAADPGGAEVPGLPDKHVDDLTRIKGLGPKLSTLLATLGVKTYAQIAAWSDEDIARIDSQIGTFAGRPTRDQWVEQAKLLASGDTAAYEGRFGKI